MDLELVECKCLSCSKRSFPDQRLRTRSPTCNPTPALHDQHPPPHQRDSTTMDGDTSVAPNGQQHEGSPVPEGPSRFTPPNDTVKAEPENKIPRSPSGPAYRLRLILSGHTRSVSALRFNPEGTILASAGEPRLRLAFVTYNSNATQGSRG